MSADIEINEATGEATIFTVDHPAWHGLGETGEGIVPVRKGLELAHIAGLEYRLDPLYTVAVDNGKKSAMRVKDKFTTTRLNPWTKEREAVGGYLSDQYQILTPEGMASLGEEVTQGGASLAAIGTFDGGTQMFLSMKVGEMLVGGQDKNGMFLNFATGFTGNYVTSIKHLAFRYECANTVGMGRAMTVDEQWLSKHTNDPSSRVPEIQRIIGIGFQRWEEFEVMAEQLSATDMTNSEFKRIVEQFQPDDKNWGAAKRTRASNARDAIFSNWSFGKEASISGTAWGAFNSMMDWIDWESGITRADDERAVRAFMDDGQQAMKDKALALVANFAGVEV